MTEKTQTYYYNILSRIREYEHLLSKAIYIEDVDILLIKIKSYIFEVKDLREQFGYYTSIFKKNEESADYKNNVHENYLKIQTLVKKILQDNNSIIKSINYTESFDQTCVSAKNSDGETVKYEHDTPILYYFPSISLPYITDFQQVETKITLASNIKYLLSAYLQTDIETPEYIEFFICNNILDNIYKWRPNSSLSNWFLYSYVCSAMNNVLEILRQFILTKILNFNNKNQKILRELDDVSLRKNNNLLDTFYLIKNNQDKSLEQLAELKNKGIHNLADSTIKQHCAKIVEIFAKNGIACEETSSKQYNAVKELTKMIPETDIQTYTINRQIIRH